jgi:hypothetical protein
VQDSNLRSRLRRGLLCTTLTSGNKLPHTKIGGVPGATAWPGLPGRNGMSSNRMRRLHSKTHPLIAAMRYVGRPVLVWVRGLLACDVGLGWPLFLAE